MQDLGILEILIAFFLFMHLVRPHFKSLWNVDGLVWFPPLALVCTIGLFPVYGFRPECLPLLLFELVMNIINFPMLQALILHLHNTDYREKGPLFFFVSFFFFAVAMITAICFMPMRPAALSQENVRVINATSQDNEEYYVRVYDPAKNPAKKADASNLIVVIPPAIGSVGAVDNVCNFLREGGFRVISFSRKNFDLPAVDQNGVVHFPRLKNIPLLFGYGKASKNGGLEKERAADIQFIFSYIKENVQALSITIIAYSEGAAVIRQKIDVLQDFFPMPVSGFIDVEQSKSGLASFPLHTIPVLSLNSALYYSDIPAKYPIIAAFASTEDKPAWPSSRSAENTAATMLNFVTSVKK